METTYEEMHTRSILLLAAFAEAMTGSTGVDVFRDKIREEVEVLRESPEDLEAMLTVLCEHVDTLLDYLGMPDPVYRIGFLFNFNETMKAQNANSN